MRIPWTAAGDDVEMMLMSGYLISVCVACVVRFPVLRHLRVTDTSCKSFAELAIEQDRLADEWQGRSCP